MFLQAIILYCCLFHLSAEQSTSNDAKCLLGDMTDMQEWVDEEGSLHPSTDDIENSIDVSTVENPVPILYHRISLFRTTRYFVKYLSMARCHLNRVPPGRQAEDREQWQLRHRQEVFQLRDSQGRRLSSTVEYLTFLGNAFLGMNSLEEQYTATFNATGISEMNLSDERSQVVHIWSAGLTTVQFPKLKELDLRACSIQILSDKVFSGMPNLTALYLAENEIFYVDSTAFIGLKNLVHLDFSRNSPLDTNGNRRMITSDNFFTFHHLENLVTLDMSFTKLTSRNLGMIKSLGKSLRGLSLCDAGLTFIPDSFFNTTSLELIDLSRNNGVFNSPNVLKGLEDSLVTLYAREVGLQAMDYFQNFSKLEILQLSCNEINEIDNSVASLRNLKVLDLDRNRITSWFKATYSLIPNLKYLSLRNNNINVITEQMITDVLQIDYLAMSGNFMVCNCHAKDFYKMAAINENLNDEMLIDTPSDQLHYKGYHLYNKKIQERVHAELDCDETCVKDVLPTGNFRLVDYQPDSYICLMVPESNSMLISDVTSCGMASRDVNLEQELTRGRNKLLGLLVIPCILLPVMLLFIFRRHIRYFFITFKNSAMLSLVHKSDTVDDTAIFNYDVFVSYCNEDRGWVLDHLLPHLEADCSISACLHERDFQVGLSILENIVSCMDRSRSIMLILSQRFLLSQWCQFEMHLAQHRLLETRREDLTLVLLEDIPRRLRPNTLHYLMLTKTYIVWPKEESDRCMFWKRIKKTLVSQKPTENVSLV